MSNALTIIRIAEARDKIAAGECKILDVTLYCTQTGERVCMTFDSLAAVDGLLHDLHTGASYEVICERNDGIFQPTKNLQ